MEHDDGPRVVEHGGSALVEQMTYRSSSSRRSGTGPGVVRVTKVVNCDCGHVVRGATDDELVAAGQACS